jgi:geranylgeranyl diphosphate synthase, type I
LFAQLMQRYLPEITQTMQRIASATLTRDEPEFGVMLRYALGWSDENDQPYQHPTGKRLRPVLLLLANEAAGGDWQKALPAAAAVEFLHNFSLIHDDIQDNSPTRHGRPTVWQVWGMANAINAGDAMFAMSYMALSTLTEHVSADLTQQVWRIFNATNIELTRGQHLDMRFEKQSVLSVDDYISMISGKTAALLAACAQMGALIATDNSETAAYYAEFGLNLGIAFQIHDDILGIWGDPKVTGKSAATDILTRKKSFPVLYGLAQNPALVDVYARPEFGDADVAEAVQLLDEVNTQDYTRQQETIYYQKAIHALEAANPTGEPARQLQEFVGFLFQRNY